LIESQITVSQLKPRILLYSGKSEKCKKLEIQLSPKYIITKVNRLSDLEILGTQNEYAMLLIDVSRHMSAILKPLKATFEKYPQSLVILWNGLPDQATLATAFQLGVCDYFPAPVNIALLIGRVDALLNDIHV
jgi:DNA-binding NtrC family response regulator